MSNVQPTIVKSTKPVIKSKPKTVIPTHVWVLLINAEEQSEPNAYLWDIAGDATAPKHLFTRIVKQMKLGQRRFLYILDSADSMAGLVNEESDFANERAEEVFEYLQGKSIKEFEYFPGVGGSPEVLITMGAC
jgi:hypothetical protein